MQLALQIGNRKQVLSVASYQEASVQWAKVRDALNLPASVAPSAFVVDLETGERVARISYNGRVWPIDKGEINPWKRSMTC